MSDKPQDLDEYIGSSADFAKPILTHLREIVHAACPGVEETFKWGHPTFMHQGILCIMSAFKEHCRFGFWKRALITGTAATRDRKAGQAIGRLERIVSLSDLPPDRVMIAYVKEAVRLNEQGIKVPQAPKPRQKHEISVPSDLAAALKRNREALETFEKFSPSHKREYIEWLTEAKREETRMKRLETAIGWIAEGKPRHWKYMNC